MNWLSGVYLGKLTAEKEGLQSYVIFIVRDDRPCDLLFQCSDLTWCAYNRWPDKWSLYDDGRKFWHTGPDRGLVSLDRPYSWYCQPAIANKNPLSLGSGEFLGFPSNHECQSAVRKMNYNNEFGILDVATGEYTTLYRPEGKSFVGNAKPWSPFVLCIIRKNTMEQGDHHD